MERVKQTCQVQVFGPQHAWEVIDAMKSVFVEIFRFGESTVYLIT